MPFRISSKEKFMPIVPYDVHSIYSVMQSHRSNLSVHSIIISSQSIICDETCYIFSGTQIEMHEPSTRDLLPKSKWETLEHPPYCPDTSLYDFNIFLKMKKPLL